MSEEIKNDETPIDTKGEARKLARAALSRINAILADPEADSSAVRAAMDTLNTLSKNPLLIDDARSFDDAKKELEDLNSEVAKGNSFVDKKLRAVGS